MFYPENLINQLTNILNMYKHTYSQKILANKQLYSDVLKYTDWIPDKFTISARIYCIIHKLYSFPKCKECEKLLNNPRNFRTINRGFDTYCCVKCSGKSEIRKTKVKQTFIQHYGIDNNMKSSKGKEEYSDAILNKYKSIKNLTDIIVQKSKLTRYTKNNGQWESNISKQKRIQTNIKKYGVACVLNTKENREKQRQTNITKLHEIQSKARQLYVFNNINFKSLPELAYYIWLTDNNIQFEYQPKLSFEYYDKYNVKHLYHPDFLLCKSNEIIEIKGDNHFDKSTGNMINISDRTKDYIANAKYKCMLDNNVTIFKSDQYSIFIDYCNNKFGGRNKFRELFRRK